MKKKPAAKVPLATVFAWATIVVARTAQQESATVPKNSDSSPPAHEVPRVERFFGTIENVNEIGKTIDIKGKVKGKEKTLSFGLDDRTKISRAKTGLKMANLKRGMYVLLEYKEEGGKLVALAIRVSAPKSTVREKSAIKGY